MEPPLSHGQALVLLWIEQDGAHWMWESPEGVPYPPGSRDRGTGIWSPRRNYVKSVTRATSSLRDDAAHLARESKCFACNAFVPPRDVGVADHLVPLSRGGSAGPEN